MTSELAVAALRSAVALRNPTGTVTRDQLRLVIVTWIEKTYHRRRRQQRLGRVRPVEFETLLQTTHTA